jgi:hypothetical protein
LLEDILVGTGRSIDSCDAPAFAASCEREVAYRGYAICFHRTLVGWICQIRKQESLAFAEHKVVCATLEQGVLVLLARARARIEAEDTSLRGPIV